MGSSNSFILLKRHLKSRDPVLNVPRRLESVATDTIFSDAPAVDSGVKQAQLFVGRDSLVADVCPMKSGKAVCERLEDSIQRQGAMDKLLSESAKTEILKKSWICSEHITSLSDNLNHTIRIRTLLNGDIEQSSP